MHWDHELPGGCSAGVLACEFSGRPARCSCWRRDAAATRSRLRYEVHGERFNRLLVRPGIPEEQAGDQLTELLQSSKFKVRCSMFDVPGSWFKVQSSMFNAHPSSVAVLLRRVEGLPQQNATAVAGVALPDSLSSLRSFAAIVSPLAPIILNRGLQTAEYAKYAKKELSGQRRSAVGGIGQRLQSILVSRGSRISRFHPVFPGFYGGRPSRPQQLCRALEFRVIPRLVGVPRFCARGRAHSLSLDVRCSRFLVQRSTLHALRNTFSIRPATALHKQCNRDMHLASGEKGNSKPLCDQQHDTK
jgi:hypothetical protein